MINKFKLLRETLPEKTKMMVYICVTVIVFAVTAVLPLAFKGETADTDGTLCTGERGAVVAAYLNNDKSISAKSIDEPSAAKIRFCESLMEKISADCRLDSVKGTVLKSGCEYIRISVAEGDIDVCRMWIQDQGDWTNWLDVYFDMDSGFIYSLYASSVCMNNSGAYLYAIDGELSTKTVAEALARHTGFELKYLSWSGKAEEPATVYTALNGQALIWNVNCSYTPGALVNISFSVS